MNMREYNTTFMHIEMLNRDIEKVSSPFSFKVLQQTHFQVIGRHFVQPLQSLLILLACIPDKNRHVPWAINIQR